MSDTTYDLGVRVGSQSDDAGLLQFEGTLKKVLDDSETLSKSLHSLSESFKKSDDAAAAAGKGAEDAGEKHRKAGEGAKEAEGAFGSLKEQLGQVAAAWLSFEGIKRAIEFMKEAALEAAEDERRMNSLTLLVSQFDKSETHASEKIEEFTKAMIHQGIEEGTTLKGLQQLIPVAGTLDNSLRGAKLASDLSTAGLMDYGSAVQLIRSLIADAPRGLMMAHKLLGIEAKTSDGALKELYEKFGGYTEKLDDNQKAIDRFTASWKKFKEQIGADTLSLLAKMAEKLKYLGDMILYGKEAADMKAGEPKAEENEAKKREARIKELQENIAGMKAAKARVEENSEAWKDYDYYIERSTQDLKKLQEEAKKGVPGEGAPTVNPKLKRDPKGGKEDKTAENQAKAMVDLAKAVEDVRKAETAEAKAALETADSKSAISTATKAVSAALDAEKKAAKDALAAEQAAALLEVKGTKEEKAQVAAINESFRQKELALEKRLAGQRKEIIEAEKAALETEHSKALQAAAASGNKVAAVNETFRQKDLALERKYTDEKWKLTLSWANKQEKLDTELTKFKKEQEEKRLKLAEKDIKLLEKAEEMSEKKALKALKKADAAEIAEKKKEYDRQLEILEQAGLKWTDEYEALSKARRQIDKIEAENKLRTNLDAIAGVMGAVSGAFKGAKAVAYAQDLIQTYLAATAAIAPPPVGYGPTFVGYAAMAAAIITGMGNAAKISSTEPKAAGGALFTSPTLSWVGEAGPELVLPYRFTRMFEQMSRDYSRGGTTINNTRNGARINIHAPVTSLSRAHGERVVEDLARRIDRATPAVHRLRLSQPRVQRGSARRIRP